MRLLVYIHFSGSLELFPSPFRPTGSLCYLCSPPIGWTTHYFINSPRFLTKTRSSSLSLTNIFAKPHGAVSLPKLSFHSEKFHFIPDREAGNDQRETTGFTWCEERRKFIIQEWRSAWSLRRDQTSYKADGIARLGFFSPFFKGETHGRVLGTGTGGFHLRKEE